MTHNDFNFFLQDILKEIEEVLGSKSADYSSNDDKLYNFKLAAEIGVTIPIEALRGMLLKHLASIHQGLDEINSGKGCRPYDWWKEKIVDTINYHILLLAMIKSQEY